MNSHISSIDPLSFQPTQTDLAAAKAVIEFMSNLGDEAQTQAMAEKVHPRTLASQFIFAVSEDGSEAFIAADESFSRDDNGAFEYWEVLSPIVHLLPHGASDTSGDGYWYIPDAFSSSAELGAYLLDAGFQWSLGAQLHLMEESSSDPEGRALESMRALIEARQISQSTALAGATTEAPRL